MHWFLLGEGEMFISDKMTKLRRVALDRAKSILNLKRFVPFMSADDIRELENALASGCIPFFPADKIKCWESLADAHEEYVSSIFSISIKKSKIKK